MPAILKKDEIRSKSVYKLCMLHDHSTNLSTSSFQDLSLELIAARLEVARLRKYPDASIAKMAYNLQAKHGLSKSTYYGHERGDRRPNYSTLCTYAQFFDIPIQYFLFGEDSERYEQEARTVASKKKKTLKVDFLTSSDAPLVSSVNQQIKNDNFSPSQKGRLRLIVKVMADDLKKIANGDASLAEIPGDTSLPAPPFLDLSEQVCWWQIPQTDFSMVAGGEAALPPGTLCLVDLEATIDPGKFVLALLKNEPTPLVRQYHSDRSWAAGVEFTLSPLNPHAKPIEVSCAEDCLLIARVVFSGSPR